jgi:hypothetical protein
VRVDGEGRTVYAVITDALAYDNGTGEPVRVFLAAVLRQLPESPLQPVPIAPVYLASEEDVRPALRMDAFTGGARPTGIPVGVYSAGGRESPVFLDCDFLLGPEAAHLNISGVSGLATKTSAIAFLLGSIFQTFPRHKGTIAAVCLNVKGSDLCFLDQPGEISADDRRIYDRLGLAAEPFADVRYFAPLKPDGVNLNTLRTHEALAERT